MPILEILTAAGLLVQAGSTIGAGVMQNKATEEANKKNLELYNKSFEETKKNNAILAGQANRRIALDERTNRFNRKQTELENERVADQTNYERLQRAGNKYAEFLNQKNATTGNRMAGLQR